MVTTDVVVVGGGPAGLAAALAARLEGLDVTLVERRRPPVDKACGEGIMPDGVEALARLGVALPAASTWRFGGIRYIEKDTEATGRFARGPGFGVRRTVLHDALVRRAEEIGVRLLWGRSVCRLRDDGVDLDGSTLVSRWVVAADGQGSLIRARLGLDGPVRHRRLGIRRHYRFEPWSDLVEVHWSTGCEIYVTPVAPDQVCVSMLAHDRGLGFETALRRFPALARRLEGAKAVTRDRGAITTFRRARAVVSGRYALVGDASATVDAITGDGVTLALHQAESLAASLGGGDLAAYAAAHRKLMRLPFGMTRMMLAINSRTWLRRLVLRSLAASPWAFSNLLALHTRALWGSRAPGRRLMEQA